MFARVFFLFPSLRMCARNSNTLVPDADNISGQKAVDWKENILQK